MRPLARLGLALAFFPAAALAGKAAPPKCLLKLEKLNLQDEVPGLTLGNTHEVYEGEGKLLRGHEPGKDAKELVDIGVTDVVIFKHPVKREVEQEIKDLKALGIPEERITSIDMPWKDIEDIKDPCQKTVQAVNAMLAVAATPGRVGYFHCSAGQDRTGMLAGLLRMVTAGWSAEKAFVSEMCAHGYGFGDTTRPANVSKAVETNLTPIFLQLASQIEGQGLSVASKLSPGLCSAKPKTELDGSRFKCK
ncbi:MAG: tyrosine-protein phosphatase [Bdellovibrionales bacterium]|nr:tyrosine-protein phosphatase [Bdellovibrionales bacterium]